LTFSPVLVEVLVALDGEVIDVIGLVEVSVFTVLGETVEELVPNVGVTVSRSR
jgi:hypothetical protein